MQWNLWGLCNVSSSVSNWDEFASANGYSNWFGDNSTLCTWSGVTCNASGWVTGVSLACDACEVPAEGSLPADLSSLPGLSTLTLSGNSLGGTLPPAWSSALPSLSALYLEGNAVSGPIPAAWSPGDSFPSLVALDLSDNLLTGSLPMLLFATMPRLSTLRMSRNRITGTVPDIWDSSDFALRLQIVALDGNLLSGSVPWGWSQLASLSSLAEIYVQDNNLTGGFSFPTYASNDEPTWQNIRIIDMSNNPIGGGFPDVAKGADVLPNMRTLGFSNTSLTGSIPASWSAAPASFKSLQSLDLRYNDLTGSFPSGFFADRPQLQTVYLKPGNDRFCPKTGGTAKICEQDGDDTPTCYSFIPDDWAAPCNANGTSTGSQASLAGLSSGALAAAVVGPVVFVAIVLGGVVFYYTRKKKRAKDATVFSVLMLARSSAEGGNGNAAGRFLRDQRVSSSSLPDADVSDADDNDGGEVARRGRSTRGARAGGDGRSPPPSAAPSEDGRGAAWEGTAKASIATGRAPPPGLWGAVLRSAKRGGATAFATGDEKPGAGDGSATAARAAQAAPDCTLPGSRPGKADSQRSSEDAAESGHGDPLAAGGGTAAGAAGRPLRQALAGARASPLGLPLSSPSGPDGPIAAPESPKGGAFGADDASSRASTFGADDAPGRSGEASTPGASPRGDAQLAGTRPTTPRGDGFADTPVDARLQTSIDLNDWRLEEEDIAIARQRNGQPARVGVGGHGTVYRGFCRHVQSVAIKAIGITDPDGARDPAIADALARYDGWHARLAGLAGTGAAAHVAGHLLAVAPGTQPTVRGIPPYFVPDDVGHLSVSPSPRALDAGSATGASTSAEGGGWTRAAQAASLSPGVSPPARASVPESPSSSPLAKLLGDGPASEQLEAGRDVLPRAPGAGGKVAPGNAAADVAAAGPASAAAPVFSRAVAHPGAPRAVDVLGEASGRSSSGSSETRAASCTDPAGRASRRASDLLRAAATENAGGAALKASATTSATFWDPSSNSTVQPVSSSAGSTQATSGARASGGTPGSSAAFSSSAVAEIRAGSAPGAPGSAPDAAPPQPPEGPRCAPGGESAAPAPTAAALMLSSAADEAAPAPGGSAELSAVISRSSAPASAWGASPASGAWSPLARARAAVEAEDDDSLSSSSPFASALVQPRRVVSSGALLNASLSDASPFAAQAFAGTPFGGGDSPRHGLGWGLAGARHHRGGSAFAGSASAAARGVESRSGSMQQSASLSTAVAELRPSASFSVAAAASLRPAGSLASTAANLRSSASLASAVGNLHSSASAASGLSPGSRLASGGGAVPTSRRGSAAAPSPLSFALPARAASPFADQSPISTPFAAGSAASSPASAVWTRGPFGLASSGNARAATLAAGCGATADGRAARTSLPSAGRAAYADSGHPTASVEHSGSLLSRMSSARPDDGPAAGPGGHPAGTTAATASMLGLASLAASTVGRTPAVVDSSPTPLGLADEANVEASPFASSSGGRGDATAARRSGELPHVITCPREEASDARAVEASAARGSPRGARAVPSVPSTPQSPVRDPALFGLPLSYALPAGAGTPRPVFGPPIGVAATAPNTPIGRGASRGGAIASGALFGGQRSAQGGSGSSDPTSAFAGPAVEAEDGGGRGVGAGQDGRSEGLATSPAAGPSSAPHSAPSPPLPAVAAGAPDASPSPGALEAAAAPEPSAAGSVAVVSTSGAPVAGATPVPQPRGEVLEQGSTLCHVDAGSPPAVSDADFLHEVTLLRACRDANVVQFVGAVLTPRAHWLITEYCEGGSLALNLARERITWKRRGLRVALDVARGMAYLHSRGVVHLDLKPGNVLLTRDGTAKISDVGLASVRSGAASDVSGRVGTLAWAAPETLWGMRCTDKADVFGFGVILWEMVTGQGPVRGNLREPRVPEECSPEAAALISACLEMDPRDRPSALEIVQILERMERHDREELTKSRLARTSPKPIQ